MATGNIDVFLRLAGLVAIARGAQGAGLIIEVKPERDDRWHDRVGRLIGFPLVMGTSQQFKNQCHFWCPRDKKIRNLNFPIIGHYTKNHSYQKHLPALTMIVVSGHELSRLPLFSCFAVVQTRRPRSLGP